jgi:hypothetical protein
MTLRTTRARGTSSTHGRYPAKPTSIAAITSPSTIGNRRKSLDTASILSGFLVSKISVLLTS